MLLKKLNFATTYTALSFMFSLSAAQAASSGVLDKDYTELWQGPYYGIYFGFASGDVDATFARIQKLSSRSINQGNQTIVTQTTSYLTSDTSGTFTGTTAELFMGYNFHKSNSKVVLGAQIEGTLLSDLPLTSTGILNNRGISQSVTTSALGQLLNSSITNFNPTQAVDLQNDVQSMFSLVGRAGILARPHTLVYGLVGPTEGHFVNPSPFSLGYDKRSTWETGITAGAGLEHKFNAHFSLIAEYRFTHFDITQEFSSGSTNEQNAIFLNNSRTFLNSVTAFHESIKTKLDLNVAKVGLVYRT